MSDPDAHTNDISSVKQKMIKEYERICFKRGNFRLGGQLREAPKIAQFLFVTNLTMLVSKICTPHPYISFKGGLMLP